MTISSTANRKTFAGDSVSTVFSFPYYFLSNSDLVVILQAADGTQTLQVITTDYTVSGAGNTAGGSVTMIVSPATGKNLIIYRDPARTQTTHWVDNDPDPAAVKETAFDKLTMIVQRLSDRSDRAVYLTDGYAQAFNPALPPVITANASLAINPAGDGFAMGPSATDITNAQANALAAAASATSASSSASSATASASAAAASATAAASFVPTVPGSGTVPLIGIGGVLSFGYPLDSTLEAAGGAFRVKDAGITQAKLAARTSAQNATAGNVAISTVFTGGADGGQAQVGQTLTLVTTGRPVLIRCEGDAGAIGCFTISDTGGSGGLKQGFVEFYEGTSAGTQLTKGAVSAYNFSSSTVALAQVPASSVSKVVFPAAGTHTYTCYIQSPAVGQRIDAVAVVFMAYEI